MMIERTLHGEWVAFGMRRFDHLLNNSRKSVVPHRTAEVSMLFHFKLSRHRCRYQRLTARSLTLMWRRLHS